MLIAIIVSLMSMFRVEQKVSEPVQTCSETVEVAQVTTCQWPNTCSKNKAG